MSRGPGKLQRAILTMMDREPGGAWTVEDLCERVYLGVDQIEKKHRVAVLRAVRSIVEAGEDWGLFQSDNTGGTLVLVNLANLMSYALGRLKADRLIHYRDKRQGIPPLRISTEEDLKTRLQPGGSAYRLIQPDGPWQRHVEMHIAARDGDRARYAELEQELKRSIVQA